MLLASSISGGRIKIKRKVKSKKSGTGGRPFRPGIGPLLSVCGTDGPVSLALIFGSHLVDEVVSEEAAKSSILAAAIGGILEKNGVRPTDLAGIVLTGGPGAFTSTRVLVSTVNGLVFVTKTPVYQVTTFETYLVRGLLGADRKLPERVIILLEAYSGEFYRAEYRLKNSRGEDVFEEMESSVVRKGEAIGALKSDKRNVVVLTDEKNVHLLSREFWNELGERKIIIERPEISAVDVFVAARAILPESQEFAEPLYLKEMRYKKPSGRGLH